MSAAGQHVKAEVRAALAELHRRARCRESLHAFNMSVEIPTVAVEPMCPDETLVGPSANLMAKHHAMIDGVLERTMNKPFGRCLIMAPPGSAKSLRTVLACAKQMGAKPGTQLIYTSYGGTLAEKQSRRCQAVVQQERYRQIFPEEPVLEKDSVKEWSLSNKSEFMASGLLGGITGNRADGIVVDDPVSGREDADSEAMRQKTLDAYQDDLLTRLKPGGWIVFIMTRWHEADLMGSILPDDYDGRSGMVRCKDGLDWEVLNIQAKCERHDDPLGRQIGEYLWPEYFPAQHWQLHEFAEGPEARRKWEALYQQRPAPQGSGRFHETMIDYYADGTQPVNLAYIGAGDYAVTEGRNDFTELGVFGVDCNGELWEVDWWNKQCDTGTSTEKTLDMIARWRIPMWFNEGGVIDKAMGPLLNLRMRQRGQTDPRVYADRRAIPSMNDKIAKCSSFQGRCASGGEISPGQWRPGVVHFRDNANSRRVVGQLIALPAGRFDDAADVCGLIGRAMDQFPVARVPKTEGPRGIKPFTPQWVEYEEKKPETVRFR